MENELIIEVGDAGKGGYWYAVNDTEYFEDGFATEADAANAAMKRYKDRLYTIYYRIWHQGSNRMMSIPGETTT